MTGSPDLFGSKWDIVKLLFWYLPIVMPYESVRDAIKEEIKKRKEKKQ